MGTLQTIKTKDIIIHIKKLQDMNKVKIKLSTIIIVSAISFLAFSTSASESGSNKKHKAPAFSYPSIESTKHFSPADFKDKYLLIDFWTSWCPHCNAASPELKRLYSEYSSKGFEILGVSIDGNEQA